MAKSPKTKDAPEGDPKRGDAILKRMLQSKQKSHDLNSPLSLKLSDSCRLDAAKERGLDKDMAEHAFREIAPSQSTKAKPK